MAKVDPFSSFFDTVEFNEDNPEPRCPCILLLDTSSSMAGAPIAAMNAGLLDFKKEIAKDELAALRVEVAIVTFGPVIVKQPFVSITQFVPPILAAEGSTPLGPAINKAMELIDERKKIYRSKGISFYRPWIFLITDGAPDVNDVVWPAAAKRVKELEAEKRVAFFSVGVEGADMEKLKMVSTRPPLRLKGLQFKDMFVWLSSSLSKVSHSKPTEDVPLNSPGGWGTV